MRKGEACVFLLSYFLCLMVCMFAVWMYEYFFFIGLSLNWSWAVLKLCLFFAEARCAVSEWLDSFAAL